MLLLLYQNAASLVNCLFGAREATTGIVSEQLQVWPLEARLDGWRMPRMRQIHRPARRRPGREWLRQPPPEALREPCFWPRDRSLDLAEPWAPLLYTPHTEGSNGVELSDVRISPCSSIPCVSAQILGMGRPG